MAKLIRIIKINKTKGEKNSQKTPVAKISKGKACCKENSNSKDKTVADERQVVLSETTEGSNNNAIPSTSNGVKRKSYHSHNDSDEDGPSTGKKNKRQKFTNERSNSKRGLPKKIVQNDDELLDFKDDLDENLVDLSVEADPEDFESENEECKKVMPVPEDRMEISDDDEDLNKLQKDPMVKKLLLKMAKKLQNKEQMERAGKKPLSKIFSNVAKVNKMHSNRGTGQFLTSTPKHKQHTAKSPSDTTIYSPALQKKLPGSNLIPVIPSLMVPENSEKNSVKEKNNIDEQVSFILGKLRRMCDENLNKESRGQEEPRPGTSRDTAQAGPSRQYKTPGRLIAEGLIKDAENFKAELERPKGKLFPDKPMGVAPPVNFEVNDNDDDFLQSTCHVDENTEMVIAKGVFIDLEKILPKQKNLKSVEEAKRLQLVTQNGVTFFAPCTDKETKIVDVQKWEHAFRVYATLYAKHNPHHAYEICHYQQTISNAAANFSWDNVAYYDYYFRQMMSRKPQRSWAKVFTELWTLSMKDPINRNSNFGIHDSKSKQASRFGDWRDNCCWHFNKNRCKKAANECRFEHKCTYCGTFNHSFANCNKRRRQSSKNGNKRHHSNDKHDKHSSTK